MRENTYMNLNTGPKTVLGIDIGSTTAKLVLVKDGIVEYDCYERHFSQVRQKTLEMVRRLEDRLKNERISIEISGSAGMGMAKSAGLPFIQEVFATGELVKRLAPDTSVVIELGGEDAKIIFFEGGLDERMNGSCAGGTGAFIDQMATLLDVSVEALDKLSLEYSRIYPIASRCGVFAKSDIQPLLNQGANKADIAAGIYQAVVDQTIAGLAQGRSIEGKVMFLGGPLYYCEGLRRRFKETLKLNDETALFPDYGRISVALGAALCASMSQESYTYDELVEKLEKSAGEKQAATHLKPLFADDAEYEAFKNRHARTAMAAVLPEEYEGGAYLGIDCGSTTTKLILITEDNRILYSFYSPNRGSPVTIVGGQLKQIFDICGDRIIIRGVATTGYGEDLIKNAYHADGGIVETMAHFTAARHFDPDVDFILDIGGQDIKCFKIHNDSIDSIMLNEACSSGCGSFIETFAKSMGYSAEGFSKLALMAKAPVDLGTRCTVFMNSSVKQAQKDGAEVGDISAGLCMSVVKNALYKVIRAGSADELGERIVVQGGTFLNDAVLRSFEIELGRDVTRPQIAGLMGAYGAALYAKSLGLEKSTLISPEELAEFSHSSRSVICRGCGNKCHLTINIFRGKEKYISGNKCDEATEEKNENGANERKIPNLFQYKRAKLLSLEAGEGKRATIGLPLALGMYELAPFWHSIFRTLDFKVLFSGFSSREIYAKGQYSIPSDTACYPAKLMHGHIEYLLEQGVDAIFYPCLTYNFDEGISDNHYNCPVVAYYSELLNANMESLKKTKFMYPYLNINNKNELARGIRKLFNDDYPDITLRQVKSAVEKGYEAYDEWMYSVREEGKRAVEYARENGKKIMILAGRPYHIDPEIGHGVDRLATSLGFVVVSEDGVSELAEPSCVDVLNQWTYHARLYSAAEFAALNADCEMVQLVSFGCGLDAITTDEVRTIMERHKKLYTQIKIDEITNLGAVKIRLRSLQGALEERDRVNETN